MKHSTQYEQRALEFSRGASELAKTDPAGGQAAATLALVQATLAVAAATLEAAEGPVITQEEPNVDRDELRRRIDTYLEATGH